MENGTAVEVAEPALPEEARERLDTVAMRWLRERHAVVVAVNVEGLDD